jgi:hypothetical protein
MLLSIEAIILQILPEETQMRHYSIYLAMATLVLASIACQAVIGGPNGAPTVSSPNETADPEVPQPTTDVSNDDNNTDNVIGTDFPMTADAYNITEAEGSLVFYTKLSAEDAMEFYRNEYTARGYTEREILTVVSDGTFSMVFDGDPSGKAVVIQSVDLGDGSRTIAIRLEDV